ncbi:condensation domain-containing protein [Streptomyces sp. NPDC058683]|uniref:condensation domain-containing protein n=1 Tax=Streptomyces sp. NPDC058683 TaxID=3346597 RepID=UPI00364DD4E5
MPFTYEQEWYDANVRRADVRRNTRLSYEILGPLNRDLFDRAVYSFVARHDAVRMDLLAGTERTADAAQRVRPLESDERILRHQDVTAASVTQFDRYASAVFSRDFLASWLPGERPYSLRLLRYAPEHHAFLATFQNIVFDGRAHHLLAHEIWRDYTALLRGEPIPQVAPSFAAAARRQRTAFGARHLQKARASWHDRLGFAALHPWRRPEHTATGDDGAVRAQLGDQEMAALRAACERERCTVMQWVVSAFVRAVAQCTGRSRLSLWTSIDSRRTSEPDVVGMFAGTAPLKILDAAAALPEVRAEVGGQILDALRYQQLTAREMKQALQDHAGDGRWLGRDIYVNLRRFEGDYQGTRHDGGLRTTADAYPVRGITFANTSALQLRCDEFHNRLFITLLFDGQRLSRSLAQAVLASLAAGLSTGAPTNTRTRRTSP